jgi:predicted peptidase
MRIVYSIITLLIVISSQAQDSNLFKKEVFVKGKDMLNYRILYPSKYDVNEKYPVVIVLHGSGERGTDNEQQLKYGAALFLDSINRVKYPAFVIFPQCPNESFWAKISEDTRPGADTLGNYTFISEGKPTKAMDLLISLVDSFAKTPQVNTKKIYVGGLSMGGMGTFEILWRKPKFFAAAFPVCGGGDPEKVKVYARNFPLWVFHGGSDDTVPVGNSRLMVNALKKNGAIVQYTEYPGVGHNSWTNAFAEPTLLKWLFSNVKK